MAERANATVTVDVPNTCGELVQGLCGGMPFLVSCPIARFARVTAARRPDDLVCGPADRPRAVAAARATRAYLGRQESGLDLTIANPLPTARGFGTSTADLVGSIGATAAVLGVTLSARDIVHLATGIEPSDSTMLFGLAVLSHRDGACWEVLGPAPDLALVVLDVGGVVDTLAYNAALDLARWSTQETAHAHALALLRAGLVRGDPRLIGRAATESALAHQNVVPGPAFPAALGLAERVGAYGVCIAHSGTALGLVLPSERGLVARVVAHARAVVPGVDAWTTRLVGGGIRYHDPVTGRLVARV